MFDDVEAFCVFIGHTRSGHSLVGSLLDAHHEAVIAHEEQVFQVVASLPALRARAGRQLELFGHVKRATRREIKLAMNGVRGPTGHLQTRQREALLRDLIRVSETQAELGRPGWRLSPDGQPSMTSYKVPGGFQGTYTQLRVIGTKRGQETPVAWQTNPAIFDDLETLVRAPVRLVHVYRNPWDNIASMGRAAGDKAPQRYFSRVRLIADIKALGRWPMLDIRHEDVVADPESETRRLFGWFGLDAPANLVSACASIVDDKPNPSRMTRQWRSGEVRKIAAWMRDVPWLADYPNRPW
ncbi:sulfotransferase [Capillimicrobium parvum]|uniref:Sulfotransferase n=1 Tax=Capillimicrobium parvum TaxID=2884022 RepID=A0A9E6XVD9_9ACTN|nr:sulfotransferase [Capillimicrobium parvum]UGS35133.1 hypothetical protein DSM104329_01518 [Capillimicrobium parvum]